MTSGFSLRRWAFAAMSTGVSVMPQASFARVLPVQGAMRRISRKPFGPMGSASSIFKTGLLPERPLIRLIKSAVLPKRESVFCTFAEKIGYRLDPSFIRRQISGSSLSKVQNEPVTARPILIPFKSIGKCSFL